jgi:protein ImuB
MNIDDQVSPTVSVAVEALDQRQADRRKSMLSQPKRILCLWLPEWPIQRLIVAEPELRQQRVVLFRNDSRKGKLVTSASPLARQLGIRRDMPLAEAKALLQHASKQSENRTLFFLREHDPVADREAIEQLAWMLEKFSPIVGLEQDFSQIDNRKKGKANPMFGPSSLLMDVTGLGHLFGGLESLAEQLQTFCGQLGYLTSVAIADTTGLAWGAAHFCADDGHPVIVSQCDQKVMKSLPVSALRLSAESTEILLKLGIETIGQLLQIERVQLRARLGSHLLKRLDQMSGKIEEPIVVCQRAAEFRAEEILDYPTSHRETIEVVVSRLVDRLCIEMKTQQLGALQWVVRLVEQKIGSVVRQPVELRLNLFQPTADKSHVMPLVAMQLEQALLPQKMPWEMKTKVGSNHTNSNRRAKHYRSTAIEVQRIAVEVVTCVRSVARQRQLFDETPGLNKEALAALINRLSSRLGVANVVSPTLRKGAQPEWSYRLKPLVDPAVVKKHLQKVATPRRQSTPSFSHVLGRPLKLIQPPVPVKVSRRVNAARAALKNTAFLEPVSISVSSHINRSVQGIRQSWGPERIETGWWRGMMVRRDYWRVLTEKGQQLWVFCDLKTQQWFLHGEF